MVITSSHTKIQFTVSLIMTNGDKLDVVMLTPLWH